MIEEMSEQFKIVFKQEIKEKSDKDLRVYREVYHECYMIIKEEIEKRNNGTV